LKNPDYIPILDNPHLVRDKKSNAVLNTNVEGLKAYRKQRDERLKINKMVEEFDSLKNDVADIKNLLKELLDKK
jgi:hypothetical protein